jgi:hypothetical protein
LICNGKVCCQKSHSCSGIFNINRRTWLVDESLHQTGVVGIRKIGKVRLGIAWASKNAALAKHKSAPILDWAALLKRDALFVNLQYGDTAQDIAAARDAFQCDIHCDPDIDQLKDMHAFAAQLAAMDHIVSVSNTSVHLAGALGAPCTLLAPPAQGLLWYWGAAGDATPWYASIRIVRRAPGHTWGEQIAAAAEILPV